MAEAACFKLHGVSSSANHMIDGELIGCHPALRQQCALKFLSFGEHIASRAPFVSLRAYCYPHKSQSFLQVKAAVGYPASMAWWKKGNQPNMRDINSAQEFVDAIARSGDKLVLVDFYSTGCRSCKALHPKICQIAEDNPDIQVLKVNFHENHALCKSLNVNILPFFQFYRGQEGRIDAFSCSLTKINKLRAAVAKHKGKHTMVPAPGPVMSVADRKDLLSVTTPVLTAAASVA